MLLMLQADENENEIAAYLQLTDQVVIMVLIAESRFMQASKFFEQNSEASSFLAYKLLPVVVMKRVLYNHS